MLPTCSTRSFNLTPVGTGPYRFEGRTDAAGVTLQANSTYYLGPPKISLIEFVPFASEADLSDALRAGEVDGAMLPEDAPASDVTFLQSDDRWAVHELQSAPYYMLYVDTRSPLFTDRDVRVAILQAIDRAALLSVAADGRGVVVNSGIPPASWAFSESEVPPFDPGASATTLEVEGFFRGRDGVRSNTNSERMSFDIVTSDNPRHVAIAENVAQQLRQVGIAAAPAPLATDALVQTLTTRQYEAALVIVDPGPDPDQYPFWHGSQILPPGLNLANYSDPRIDETVERARQTTDVERRRDLYALFNGYYIGAMPSFALYAPSRVYVQASRVRGFEPRLLYAEANRFTDVQNWYVETRSP